MENNCNSNECCSTNNREPNKDKITYSKTGKPRNQCLGFEMTGKRCIQKLPISKTFCHRHDPIPGLGYNNNCCPTSVPRSVCKVEVNNTEDKERDKEECGEKGLFGLSVCYDHFDGKFEECTYCRKSKKMRKTICGHSLCVSCFVQKDDCPVCHVKHKDTFPTETKHIPKQTKDIINSLFRSLHEVSNETEQRIISRLIQKHIEPYYNIHCPCCESNDEAGSSNTR